MKKGWFISDFVSVLFGWGNVRGVEVAEVDYSILPIEKTVIILIGMENLRELVRAEIFFIDLNSQLDN